MKVKSDFENYNKEDFGKLLQLITKKYSPFIRCFEEKSDWYKVYYNSAENTLYQMTENNEEASIIGDVLYRNSKYTLSVYTLANIKNWLDSLEESCRDYNPDFEDSFAPKKYISFFRLLNEILETETSRPTNTRFDLPF